MSIGKESETGKRGNLREKRTEHQKRKENKQKKD
jgi:hypothetical protein